MTLKTSIMKTEKTLFMKTFKSVRGDGHAIRTFFALTESGVLVVKRTIISDILNEGFVKIRSFGKYVYQEEEMSFKFESFLTIASTFQKYMNDLEVCNITKQNQIIAEKNSNELTKLTT